MSMVMRKELLPPPLHDAEALLELLQAEVEKLYASGYMPVPLAKDEKNPRLRRWTKTFCHEARPPLDSLLELLAQQVLNYGANGLGIAMRNGLVCVDIDNPAATQRLREIIGSAMDQAPIVVGRRGDKRFFRTQDGKNPSGLNLHVQGLLDLLVRSKQAVIPPTVHPETGKPYWWNGPSMSDVPIAELPTLSYLEIEAIHREFGKAPSNREQARIGRAAGQDVPKDILRHLVPPQFTRASGRSTGYPDEARRLAEALTFISAEPYTDGWLKVGMALCLWDGAEARPLWDTWSGGGQFMGYAFKGYPEKFSIGAQDEKWRSFAEATARGGVTVGTIIHWAKERGFDASLGRWPGLRGRRLEASNIGEIAAHMPPEREAIDALLHYAREDGALKPRHRDVLAAAADYVNNANRTAWPALRTIATHLDLPPKTLTNWLTKLYERGYLVRDPGAINPDGTRGCWAFVPPDELTWDELIILRRLALGHGEETATRGLDVAVEGEVAKSRSGANEQPLHESVEDLAAVAAKVKDIDIHAEMWTILQEVEAGRRASEVLFGANAARMPAAIVKSIDMLAAAAARAVSKLVAALSGAIHTIATKHAELERLRGQSWFGLLPPRVQQAVGHAVLGKQRTVQIERLEELMRAVTGFDPQYRPVHDEFLKTTISGADAGLDRDWAKKQPANASALSPIQLLHKFRAGILFQFVRQGVSAPGVIEFAENLQRRRVAEARREQARRQADEQIPKRRRTAA
jgi:hypothetical protein